MQKRLIFTLMMTVLLLVGGWSSVACEMACLPQGQSGICCSQQMHSMAAHCEHASGPSFMAMHDCSHSQDHRNASSANVPPSTHVVPALSDAGILPSDSLQAVNFHNRAQSSFLNRPPNLPLRI
jgi:hypothetical protein